MSWAAAPLSASAQSNEILGGVTHVNTIQKLMAVGGEAGEAGGAGEAGEAGAAGAVDAALYERIGAGLGNLAQSIVRGVGVVGKGGGVDFSDATAAHDLHRPRLQIVAEPASMGAAVSATQTLVDRLAAAGVAAGMASPPSSSSSSSSSSVVRSSPPYDNTYFGLPQVTQRAAQRSQCLFISRMTHSRVL